MMANLILTLVSSLPHSLKTKGTLALACLLVATLAALALDSLILIPTGGTIC